MSINYLVTGGLGFLGQHLVEYLLTKPSTKMVRIVDLAIPQNLHNISQTKWKSPQPPQPPIHYCKLDILQEVQMIHALVDIDVVFHIAAKVELGATHPADYGPFYKINVTGTKKLLQACLKMCVTKFVFVSSVSVIFDRDSPGQMLTEQEKYPTNHVDHYAATKCLSEIAVLESNNLPCHFPKPPHTSIALSQSPSDVSITPDPVPQKWPRLQCVVIRPGVIFGAGCPGFENGISQGGINCLAVTENNKTSGIPQSLFSSPYSSIHNHNRKTSLIDFVYVENVTHALFLASDRLLQPTGTKTSVVGQVYHITNMDPWSIGEFWTHNRLLYLKKPVVPNVVSSPLKNKNVITIFPHWLISFIVWLIFGIYTIMRYAQGTYSRWSNPVNANGVFWNPLIDMPPPKFRVPISPAFLHYFSTTYTLDCSKAQKELGYKPIVGMLEASTKWIASIHARESIQTHT